MWNSFKERMVELGWVIWVLIITLIVTAVLAVGLLAINGVVLPWERAIDRNVVEQSKSFTDSNNNMLATYMLEYGRLDVEIAKVKDNPDLSGAYISQQKAIVGRMCKQMATMNRATIEKDIAV